MTETAVTSRYFPEDRKAPCYAVYATAIDRFLAVDRHDLSTLLRAAMLFSSKLITIACVYDSKTNPVLSNDVCMNYAPVHRLSQADSHLPRVLMLDGPDAIVEKGPVRSVPGEMLSRAQRYLLFTLDVLYAQFMANAKRGHADVRVFHRLIPCFETLPNAPLSRAPELFAGQVRDQKIEEILYYADSFEDAQRAIRELVNHQEAGYRLAFNECFYRPTPDLVQ